MRQIAPIRAVKDIGVFLVAYTTFALALCLPLAAQSENPANVPEPAKLTLGQSVQRDIAGGQKLLFGVACVPGHIVRVSVEQKGIDVIVRLLDAQQTVVQDYDSDPRIIGEESVEFVSEINGNCTLAVESRQRSARQGSFAIKWIGSRESTAKEKALDESRRLLGEATRLWRASKYDAALPLAERTLAIRERELGPEHADVGLALFTIANIYSDIPDFKKAAAFYERAIENRSRALGAEHFSLASIYNNFGVVYKERGQYAKAEVLFERALRIREKVLEPGHLLIASALNNLAMISRVRGDPDRAAALYRGVLEIREKALGPDHADVATAANNLANTISDLAAAEPLYVQALAIREKLFPPDHPDIAQTLYNLAINYSHAGDQAKADAACNRALAIWEKGVGPEHPLTTLALNLSGIIAKNKGDFEKTEQLFERTIVLKEKVQGPLHPDLGGTFANLANVYAIRGNFDKAVAAQARANEILDYNTSLNLLSGSERDKLNYIQSLSYIADQTLTLSFIDAKMSKAAAELSLTTVLRRKGRVLDAMSDSLGSLRRRLNPQDQLLLDELTDITSKLSSFVLEGPKESNTADYGAKLAGLETRRESIERQISRQSSGYFEPVVSAPLNAVRNAIPENAALVEFAVFRPISRKSYEFTIDDPSRSEAFREPHYVVFVVRRSGEIQAKDLGSATEIESMIVGLRKALRAPAGGDLNTVARKADEAIMQPVRALLGDATQLLIAPDGELNLIPFEALISENGQFLVEKFAFSYVTSGRDLLRNRDSATRGGKPVIVAAPLFGEPAEKAAANLSEKVLAARQAKRKSKTSTRSLSETYFAPLGGTALEARAIQAIFPDAVTLTGLKATETSIKEASAPKILHLATHGFFLDAVSKPGNAGKQTGGSTIENPLLRSGLAFSGANKRHSATDDGILTALEASGLNLWGTKLVVLSACDTGIGEVRSGEGVFGLRRSFVIAGAESLVMSMWPVSDYVTRELMTGYYKNLKQGMGRGESLRRIQLEMLKRPNRRHPFYWASFIQSGEWANLDGKR